MRKIFILIGFVFAARVVLAQCDTTGLLLELQATTNLSGIILGQNKCFTSALIQSPLSVSGDTIRINTGNLTAASNKVAITGGTNAVLGSGSTVDIVPANILLSTLGGSLNLSQISTSGASAGQIIKFNGTSWAVGNDSIGSGGGGSGTVTSIGYTAPASGLSISGTNPVTTTGTWTFSLADDLAALEGISGTGIAVRTAANTWTTRSIIAGTNVTINNGDGVGGNIEINVNTPNYQNWYDNNVLETGRNRANFLNTGDILLSLTDDAVGGETEVTASIATNAVDNNQFRQSVGLSVVGRSTNTTGDVADITAGTDAHVLRRSGTSLGFGQVATGGIADAAVTYAKIQNVTATRLLGRGSAAGAGPPVEIDIGTGLSLTGTTLSSTATGTVTGTGTNGRLALWTGTSSIGDDAAFTYDGANDRMTITGTVAGTGSNNAFLNLNGGSITGTVEALRASVNASTSLDVVVANSRNTGNTGSTKLELEVGGTSAADPYILFSIPSGTDYALGIDNGDADKLKITPGGTAPGSTANKGLILTTDAATLIGFNRDAPLYHADVNGRVRASTGFIGDGVSWNSGLIAFGTGAGTAGSLAVNSITGCDNWMYISFTTGNAPVANGTVFTATYPNAWPASWNISFVTFSAANANAATDITKFRTANRIGASFQLVANGTLTANTNYQFVFQIGSMD